MNTRIGKLGETEWALMKICWKIGKSSAKVIHDEVIKEKNIQYQTVKTILDRLVVKKLLAREKFGPIWLYTPKVTEDDLTSHALDEFVKTVFGNTIAPILLFFVQKEKYKHEVEELKQLINNIDEEE